MLNRGINSAANNVVINPADRQKLTDSQAPRGFKIEKTNQEILTLNAFETKCLLIQLANLESNTNSNLTSVGVPTLCFFRTNIIENTVVS